MAKRILIVDDSKESAKLLKTKIEATTSHEVLVAMDGPRALELVKTIKPDLVLLDIMMPGMDGFEVLRQIKTLAPELPVAMVSAVWDEKEARRALQAGAYDYVTKPVDFNYLEKVVLVKLFA